MTTKLIPEQFYRADLVTPMAGTVGALITQLKRLPSGLPLWPQGEGVEIRSIGHGSDAFVVVGKTERQLQSELTAARDEAERLRARVAELESGRPPKLEWRKRVSKWSAFLEGLKGAPIPKGQRNTAASIKKEIDRYIEYGIGHDEPDQ